MLYYLKKGRTQLKHRKGFVQRVEKLGDGSNVSEVVCAVRAGDFSLDDAPRSGGPAHVDSDQIETLIENNQRSTTHSNDPNP